MKNLELNIQDNTFLRTNLSNSNFKFRLKINKQSIIKKYNSSNNRYKKNDQIRSLDTFKKNKKKYNILLDGNYLNLYKKKLKKKIFDKIKKKNLNTKNSELSHDSKYLKSLETEKNYKTCDFNIKKNIIFKKKKSAIFKTLNMKIYKTFNINRNIYNKIDSKDYNNYFNEKFKTLSGNKLINNIKNNIGNYVNSKHFNLNFKKKELIEQLDFENSVMNLDENFKKLDLIYDIMSKEKLLKIQNKIKGSIRLYKSKNNHRSLKKIREIKNIDWKEVFTSILQFCIKKFSVDLSQNLKNQRSIKKPKKKIKIKKTRVFNRENKYINGNYSSLWINIINNLLNKKKIDDVGYYKIKIPKSNSYSQINSINKNKVKSMSTLKKIKFNFLDEGVNVIMSIIEKVEDDIYYDHLQFSKF